MPRNKPASVPCLHCGKDVPQTTGPGRVKRYCTPWHGKAHRASLVLMDLNGNILD